MGLRVSRAVQRCHRITEEEVRDSFTALNLDVFHALLKLYYHELVRGLQRR